MKVPKIVNASYLGETKIFVEFSDGSKKVYDLNKFLNRDEFSLLKNKGFIKNFKIEKDGSGIYWNDKLDISEYELWKNSIN